MALKRTSPRRTVTLSGLSFAAGSIELIHPEDVPFTMLVSFHDEGAELADYYMFCAEQGAITIDDLEFLVELTADETIEVWETIQGVVEGGLPGPNPTPKSRLSPDEEQLVEKFSDRLNGMFPAQNPPGDKPDADIVDEIGKVLGEEGDEPTD